MNCRERKFIQTNHYYLCLNLIINESVFVEEISTIKFFKEKLKNIINDNSSNFNKVNKFLTILPKGGPKAFDCFLKALELSKQLYLLNILKSNLDNLSNISLHDNYDENDFIYEENTSKIESRQKLIIILNVLKYESSDLNRYGSEKDVSDIKEFFVNKNHYELFCEPIDPSSVQIIENLQKYRDKYFSTEEKTVTYIFIMCHGKSMHIIGSDSQLINYSSIFNILNFRNPNVIHVIVFSCCRGPTSSISYEDVKNKEHDAIDNTGDQTNLSITEEILNDRFTIYFKSKEIVKDYSNTVTIFSTQDNYLSYREDKGTVFIQSFIHVLKEHYKQLSLRQIVRRIKSQMRQLFPVYLQFPEIDEYCPCDIYI